MKRLMALTLALLLVLSLVACGGDKPTTSNPGTSTPGTSTPADPAKEYKKDVVIGSIRVDTLGVDYPAPETH